MVNTSAKGAFDGVFDKVAGEYDTEGVLFFRPVAERLVELLGIEKGQQILDVGCGRGAVTFPLAEAVGPTGRVFGIDLSAGMVEALRASVAAAGVPNIEVRHMDGQRPGFEPREFDAITGSMSIVMLPDLAAAFRDYARLLRPGGTLAFTAPDTRNQIGAWKTGPVDIGRLAAEIPGEALRAHPMLARLINGDLLDLSAVPALLAEAGFADVVEHREEIAVVADTPAGLVRWTQQHGMRAVWDAVPDGRRAAVERALTADATAQAGADGKVRFGFPVAYFVARGGA
ncbi:class I SAM-dependent methyltransferase [Nonomuraea longicatena]|uniref:Carboxylate O-methyltransferase n=1 Tax=Nonomuraea longicatena TaxID=83682 RepID=C9W345_9ACTN|nr:carboxylate O-methyltransferase [Nonomuraea longicatena]